MPIVIHCFNLLLVLRNAGMPCLAEGDPSFVPRDLRDHH